MIGWLKSRELEIMELSTLIIILASVAIFLKLRVEWPILLKRFLDILSKMLRGLLSLYRLND